MTSGASIKPPQDSIKYFLQWFLNFFKIVPTIIFGIIGLIRVIEWFLSLPPWLEPYQRVFPPTLNVFVILVLLTFLPRVATQGRSYPMSPGVEKYLNKFLVAWGRMWFVWLIFYLANTCEGTLKTIILTPELEQRLIWIGARQFPTKEIWMMGWEVSQDLLNNLQTLYFFICALHIPNQRITVHSPRLFLFSLAGFLGALTCAEYIWAILDPHAFLQGTTDIAFGLFSGGFALCGLVLLTKRLSTKILRVHPWLIWLLYGYGVIQIGYGLSRIGGWDSLENIVFSVALVLKIGLFAVVAKVVSGGHLAGHYRSLLTNTSQENA